MRKLLLLLVLSLAFSTTYFVAPSGDDSNSGTEQNPFLTIDYATQTASDGDSVLVASGMYFERITLTNKGLSIIGDGSESVEVVPEFSMDFDNNLVFNINMSASLSDSVNISIQGMTLSGTENGYAITASGASNNDLSLHLSDMVFTNNDRAIEMLADNQASFYADNIKVYNNSADDSYESIIRLYGLGSVTITNSEVYNNSSLGTYNSIISLTNIWEGLLDRVLIYNNECGENCNAGAIYMSGTTQPNVDPEITINRCTIVNNESGDYGFSGVNAAANVELIINSSIIRNNTSDYNIGTELVASNNSSANYLFSNIQNAGMYDVYGDGSNDVYYNIDADPLFYDAANGNYSLMEGSPCINTGDPQNPLDPDGSYSDMGAIPFYIVPSGCTDPGACNYDSDAEEDDGSCEFEVVPILDIPLGLEGAISLSWSESEYATMYRIFSNDNLIDTTTNTIYTHSNLAPGITNNYKIQPVGNHCGLGNFSNEESVSTSPLSNVELNSLTAGQGQIQLSWSMENPQYAGESYSFDIYMDNQYLTSRFGSSYTVANLEPGQEYCFYIVAHMELPVDGELVDFIANQSITLCGVPDEIPGWSILIEVESEVSTQEDGLQFFYDSYNEIGANPDATDGFDAQFDYPEPPMSPTSGAISLSFYHPEWSMGDIWGNYFTSDIRELKDITEIPEIYNFQLNFQGNLTQNITLSFDAIPIDFSLPIHITFDDISYKEIFDGDTISFSHDTPSMPIDGTIFVGGIWGCTNPDAINYEEDAVFDDGSCVVPDIIVPDDYSSIQSALDSANEGNTIFVRPGIYYEYSIEWPLLPNIKLIGAGREITIIDAQNNDRAFIIDGNNNPVINHNSIIEGFTIKNGYNINAGLPGGALTINFAQPTLRNLIIEDSEGYTGGAVWIRGDAGSVLDTLIIDDVIFKNNNAIHGGGLAIAPMQYLGEVESRPYISIENSHFINNSSNGSSLGGGGIFVHIRSANLNIDNSSFIGNTSSNDGGAILLDEAHLSQEIIISNSIIIDNIANGGNTIDGLGYSIISNSIIYGNTPIVSYGSININSIIEGAYIDDNNFYNCFNSDPLFIDYNNGNYLLSPNSPCIDSGTDYVEYNGEILYNLSPDEYEGFAPDIGPYETSQMFVPDPIITNIEDIDNDQGGRVFLDFQRSFYDKDGFANRVEVYTVERMSDDEWVGVLTQSAYNDSTYRVEVTTLIDSSSTSDGLTDFRVIANMEEGNFLSETSTGYSVDNIHPSVPEDMFVSSSEQDVNLSWSYSEDIDFAHHMVSDIADNPAYTIDNDISIPLTTRYNEYHVNSMDINGNMSDNSEYASAYDLSQGANLISFSILPEDNGIENVILSEDVSSVIGEGIAAMQISNGQWVGSLVSIYPDQGYWVKSSNGEILNTVGLRNEITDFNLNAGANLISYTCDQSAPVEDIIQDMEITSVIGEGLATTYNPVLGWVGSLSSLEPGSGYWFKADSDVDFSFDCPESETFSREYVEAPIKDYIQSTEQAFYFFSNISEAEEGDVIRAYNGEILVGSRLWSGSYTDVPVMGKDFQSETQGFLSDSDIPTFKLIKKSGEELMLQADIPGWSSNGIFMIENASSSEIIPDNFGLASAYPNPFNPTTTISFQLPYESNVVLDIYDITGRKIRQLSNNYYTPGYHSVIWDASDVSSGVYFVKMNADGFNASQKLMLIK